MADLSMSVPSTPDRLDRIPARVAEIAPQDITGIFPRPTLIELGGDGARPLFLSLLLHGNERAGFGVLQALARRYRDARPERPMMIFVGNVEAVAADRRQLPGQPDFNRIWAGGEGPYCDLVAAVTARARDRNVFASIDIHNTSGANPHYGSINVLRPADLHLAARFADIGVYYRVPGTTQSIAFSSFCPAVTVECGKSGDAAGIARALGLIDHVLALDHFPTARPVPGALRLYKTVGVMTIAAGRSFAFGGEDAELRLRPDFEQLNFTDLEPGTPVARFDGAKLPLRVSDEHGRDITASYLQPSNGAIVLARAATPAMITPDPEIARRDCLGYLMAKV